MSSSASGVIGNIQPRNTKVGVTYTFVLDGPDDNWYGTFKDTPPPVGSFVAFDYVQKGAFYNVEMKTLVVTDPEVGGVAGGADVPVPPPAATAAFSKASNKDANIQWQSARNAAVATMNVMAVAGSISLGAGKADAKLAALVEQINQLTLDYFDSSMEVSATGEAPEDFRG